jgi:hypothetical protein
MTLRSPPLTWHTYQIIIDFFGAIVVVCISNQFKSYWLLNDALNFVIFMSLRFKDKIDFAPFDNLMEEMQRLFWSYNIWVSNLKMKMLRFWILLFSFLRIFFKKFL